MVVTHTMQLLKVSFFKSFFLSDFLKFGACLIILSTCCTQTLFYFFLKLAFITNIHLNLIISATDFANRTTVQTSEPVTVDTSPPNKFDKPITLPGRHITSTAEIEAW